jgi:thiol-disulfide isomerase/thioredoxin
MLFYNIILSISLSLSFISFSMAGSPLQDMDGHNISFSDLRGKWVLINYWASWCQACLDEIPEFNRFYEDNKNNDVVMFAVNYDGLPVDAQKKLMTQWDIHYPSLKKDPSSSLHLGDIRGVPVTFVFNPQGQLSHTLYGGQTINDLKRAITTLPENLHQSRSPSAKEQR